MTTINTDIEVDLNDFDDWELREELEIRGYYVSRDSVVDLDDMNDEDLIDELKLRGYTTYGKKSRVMFELYQSFVLDNEERFREHVKKLLIENGFQP